MRLSPCRGPGRWWMLFLLALGTAGCSGRPTGTVSGTVSFKGTPLKGGHVIFLPSEEGGAAIWADIGEDGRYTANKVPAGPVQVGVETEKLRQWITTHQYKRPSSSESPGAALAKRYVWIPPQYADPHKSGLTCTVESGWQSHDIDLK